MELALLSPVMVLIVFGVLDLSRAYRLNIRLENAAREGAAFAQVYPNDVTCGPSGSIRGQVLAEEAGLAALPGFQVVVTGQDEDGDWVPMSGCAGSTGDAGERVRVEVRARYDVMTPVVAGIVGGTLDLDGEAEVRVQGRVLP